MSLVLEIIAKMAEHSTSIAKLVSILTDYEEGTISEDDARREMERIEQEFSDAIAEQKAQLGG